MKGFSLVEAVIAMLIFSIVLVPIMRCVIKADHRSAVLFAHFIEANQDEKNKGL